MALNSEKEKPQLKDEILLEIEAQKIAVEEVHTVHQAAVLCLTKLRDGVVKTFNAKEALEDTNTKLFE